MVITSGFDAFLSVSFIKNNESIFPVMELMLSKNITGKHRIEIISVSPVLKYFEKNSSPNLQWIRYEDIFNKDVGNNIITNINNSNIKDLILNKTVSKNIIEKSETMAEQRQFTIINDDNFEDLNKEYIDDDGLEIIEPELPPKKEDIGKKDSSTIKDNLLQIKMIEEDMKNIDLNKISKEWGLDFLKTEKKKQTTYKTYKDDDGFEIILPLTSLEEKALSENYLKEDKSTIENN